MTVSGAGASVRPTLVANSMSHPLVLPDPAAAPPWRPRGIVLVGVTLMAGGAFGPWLAGKLAGGSAGVDLGGDGWLLVVAAGAAVIPVLLGFARGLVGVWAMLMALAAGFVCLVHYQQAQVDGFRDGWGLYVAAAGCATLAFAGFRWLNVSGRRT